MDKTLFEYLLRLGDSSLILSQRLGAWTGHGPILEEDLALTNTAATTNILLITGYVVLSLPYMYRAVDTGLRAIDVRTLTEAAQSLGATWPNGLFPLPPMRLDHVFVSRDLTALDVAVGTGAGSDHRPVVARIARRAR